MVASEGFAKCSDFIVLRVSLGLDSADAIRLSRACKACHNVIEDSADARSLWSSMLPEKSARGILNLSCFWLHALLQWREITSYRKQARRFTPLFELHFHSPLELMKLLTSINVQNEQKIVRMISGLHDVYTFLGEWRIPKDSIITLRHTGTNVLGLPVTFDTVYGEFSVALQLSMVGPHAYRLTWQVDVPVQTRMEAYSLEVDVSGTLVPDGEEEAVPRICDSFERRGGDDYEESVFIEEGWVYKNLAAGHPLICFARIAVSSMGDACSVTPSTSSIDSYDHLKS